ncbi:hypothetical protein [Ktedonospora formicarum]|uniref:Uncharacterized protein n=1 Tax=Ktedonospora formicarum TaxID=2778364 RepID=A0A8J3I4H3_9CHLR|nr:hypothetical protein [Ktedonospora formicarum]GHO46853.1 hypothetical protein KSX_50160 [Ktedonospora formicarum]
MTDKKQKFEPERLDQQIDEAGHNLDVSAEHLIEDLRWLYRAPVAETTANAESLRRVRERLEEGIRATRQQGVIISLQEVRSRRARSGALNESREVQRPGWSRFSRIFGGIAVVLVAALVVASSLILFNSRKEMSDLGKKTTTPTPVKSVAKVDCSYAFADNYYGVDNGEHAACLRGEETLLNLTKIINGQQVTLISAYADTNRTFVRLAIDGEPMFVNPLYIDKLIVQQDISLPLGPTANIYFYDTQHKRTIQLISFDSSAIPMGTTTLNVHEDITGFDFMIPFHSAKRVALPGKELSINGHTVNLKGITVTHSQTIIYIESAEDLPPNGQVNLEGMLNGKKILVEAYTDAHGNGKQGKVIGWYATVQEDLMQHQGNWILKLNSKGPPLGEGSVETQFVVPRA